MKKYFVLFLIVAILLLLAVPSSFSFANPSLPIIVEFPSPVGNLLGSLPVKVIIPDPKCFGFPRIPVEISVALAEFRNHKVIVPLLEEIDLTDPLTLKKFLDTPIEKVIDYPLPVHKVGRYNFLVDIKCLYGPDYRWSYWYSFTANFPFQIIPERAHVVFRSDDKFYGYTLSQSVCYDFLGKGHSFRIQVEVVNAGEVLYTEAGAIVGTFFDPPSQEEKEKEIEIAYNTYQFLLDQYQEGRLVVSFIPLSTGDWRWLFSTQLLSWVEKNGIIIDSSDPHWSWNPQGEFQYEYIVD